MSAVVNVIEGRIVRYRLSLLVLLAACGDCRQDAAEPAPAPQAVVELDLDDPSTCAACHAPIVEEWRESMHAHAHQSEDPIYAAMRSLRMQRQGEQVAGQCGSCHHPLVNDAPDAPLAALGVSCRSCHGVAQVREGAGHAGLTWTEGRLLRGPHDVVPDASPAHGTGPAAPHLTDGRTLCLTCHREARNAEGVVTCNTGNELADVEASCTSCHMPEVDAPSGAVSTRPTHRSHTFVGPHAAWRGDDSFLKSAVAMRAELEGGELVVTLENRSGHAFPTGFPGRFAVLQAMAKDAAGTEVWRAWREDPSEAPQAMLNQVYLDADGEPTMAPFASSLARDTRLRANETRQVRFAVPAEAMEVSVALRFFLVAPKAARALGLTETPEAAPRVVAEARATR